jgi:ubiquinone biosynthesis O-methyltransferase
MNPIRIEYILEQMKAYHNVERPRILDIGCGGGLLSFPVATACSSRAVLGIDQSERGIIDAQERSKQFPYSSLSSKIEFRKASVQDLGGEEPFDMILAMEMLEHVESTEQSKILHQLLGLLAPGGMFFMSTINRSVLSRFLTIDLAERLLSLVPQGTHNPDDYIKPEEFTRWVQDASTVLGSPFLCRSTQGLIYRPWCGWTRIPWTGVHYMMAIQRL